MVSVSASHTVGHAFAFQPGHTAMVTAYSRSFKDWVCYSAATPEWHVMDTGHDIPPRHIISMAIILKSLRNVLPWDGPGFDRARKSRTTLQNKVRLKVLPEQLTLSVNTSVTLKKCIIQ